LSRFKLFLKPSAIKDLRVIPFEFHRLIKSRIEKLGEEPLPPDCKKLSDSESLFRVRQGKYRIIYTIDFATYTVSVLAIDHRREAYRSLN